MEEIKKEEIAVAYFSMEIALDNRMKTYSGGLGVLAGDFIKSAADLEVPIVAVSILSEKGYFKQKINDNGEQVEEPDLWDRKILKKLKANVSVKIEGRDIKLAAWLYEVEGITECKVPVIFLDTDVEGNSDYDRSLNDYLYGGDDKYRIAQEIILGIGGVRMLEKLGYKIKCYHMNEGHASFLTLELLNRIKRQKDAEAKVREKCVFTTHTPVASGHDRFDIELVKSIFGSFPCKIDEFIDKEGKFNMTLLGLHFSRHINGVAKKHGEVSHEMFPFYRIDYITNGVHSATWTSEPFAKLFDKHIEGWKSDSFALRYAIGIPEQEIWDAHQEAKKNLIDEVNKQTNAGMDLSSFTIGFARRATPYKRALLLFHDIERLKEIARKFGKIQIIYAGKAHPKDLAGKEFIKKINSMKLGMGENMSLVFLENYDMELAKVLVAGCDIWLNTPLRPLEASGTSGMKAAHNGVPSFSVLDGWWLEGHMEDLTGWSIGPREITKQDQDEDDANDLYEKLENKILQKFQNRHQWAKIMKSTIAFNASFFNSQRMVTQYVLRSYFE